jgi:hypothetical protein
MKIFWKGFLTGAAVMLVLGFLVLAASDAADYNRKTMIIQEQQHEAEELLEDYSNRDPYEFLDDNADVRGAADSNVERFRKKRDEILQRRGGAEDS